MEKLIVLNIVREVINYHDPIGLLREGAPQDEYTPEINDIAGRITKPHFNGDYEDCIREVFSYWFRPKMLKPGVAETVGAALAEAIQKSRTGK